MKKEEFYFDSRDGKSKIHAVRYYPEQETPLCVVQIIHGMAEYVERYEQLARFLTDRGCMVIGEDHLGHGKSVGEDGIYGYFCDRDPATVVVRDTHRLKKLTQQMYPEVPFVILGHSMGSFILRNYICRYGSGISGAIIMGTGMQPKALIGMSKALAAVQKVVFGPRHISKLIDKAAFGGYNKRIQDAKSPSAWLSADEAQVAKYDADSLCGFKFTVNGFQTLFELISRVQKKQNLEKIPKELPLLIVSGSADPVGDYGAGVKRAYESLLDAGLKHVTLKLFEGGRHEILNELNKEEVMQELWQWIVKVV